MLSTMMHYPLSLNHILERAGTIHARREIVTRRPDRSIHRTDFGAFNRRTLQLASGLQAAGLKPGERVATLMWNHWAHLEAYFGIPAARGVMHTLNLRLAPDDIGWIARNAGDRFLLVDDILLPLLEKFRGKAGFERIFVFPFSGAPIPAGFDSYEDLLASGSADFRPVPHDENEAVSMCYTSGTTGRPKGVVYSHRSTVLHSFVQVMGGTALMAEDTLVPVVPMFHANAWGYPYSCVMLGARMVFPGPHLDAVSLLELMEREKATVAGGVPTIWLGLLNELERDPGRWKLQPMRMLVGGAAVPESLFRAFDRHNLRIIQGWGMTETSPLATVSVPKATQAGLTPDERYAVRAKQGYAMPFVELRAVGDDGEVPWDGASVGEIQVRGPWITGGYFNETTDPEKFTSDGWLRTGDVASIDAEGFVKITDRSKDLIKSGGEWISSVDLENAIMGHPSVQEAAVIAVPHPRWSERPLAVVVTRPDMTATADDLRAYLAQRFEKWMLPDAIVFVPEIPRTSTGKFLKTALRERYRDWDWSAPAGR